MPAAALVTPVTPPHPGLILLAHGSRDPAWSDSIVAIARRCAELSPQTPVRCAYLELCEPTLAQCAAELADAGVQTLTITPLFLGMGKHVREDLPQRIQALALAHPQMQVNLQASAGEHQLLINLLAKMALSLI